MVCVAMEAVMFVDENDAKLKSTHLSRNVACEINFPKIKDEMKCEEISIDEPIEDMDVTSVKHETLTYTELVPFFKEGFDKDDFWRDHDIHSEENIKPDLEAYLGTDLPRAGELLQSVEVEHGNNINPVRKCFLEISQGKTSRLISKGALNGNVTSRRKKRIFCCPDCDETFTRRHDLRTHMGTHSVTKEFSCLSCAAKFCWESSLRRHQKVHNIALNQGLPTSCRSATVDVKKCNDLPSCTRGNNFSCSVCGKKFSRHYHVKLHKRIHSGEKPHACTFCSAKFNRKDSLQLHVRTHTGERPYSCSLCGLMFTQKTHLKTHMGTHSSVKYTCALCNNEFSQKIYLIRHMRTHSGERPYSCPFCSATFANTSSASRHIRVHSGKSRYSCEDCGMKFIFKDALKRHFRTVCLH